MDHIFIYRDPLTANNWMKCSFNRFHYLPIIGWNKQNSWNNVTIFKHSKLTLKSKKFIKSQTTSISLSWQYCKIINHFCTSRLSAMYSGVSQKDFYHFDIFIEWRRLRFVSSSPSALRTFWIYSHPNTTSARELPRSPNVDRKTNMV